MRENKDFCGFGMTSEDIKILEFNQYQKSDKIPSIISADFEPLIKTADGCRNNPEKPSTIKVGENIPCGYSMSTIRTCDGIENKHGIYKSEGCIKKFCESLKEHAMAIINFEKKKMIPLTSKKYDHIFIKQTAIFSKNKFGDKYTSDKNYRKGNLIL